MTFFEVVNQTIKDIQKNHSKASEAKKAVLLIEALDIAFVEFDLQEMKIKPKPTAKASKVKKK